MGATGDEEGDSDLEGELESELGGELEGELEGELRNVSSEEVRQGSEVQSRHTRCPTRTVQHVDLRVWQAADSADDSMDGAVD